MTKAYNVGDRVVDRHTKREARIVRVDKDPHGHLYLLDDDIPVSVAHPDRWRLMGEIEPAKRTRRK